MFFLGFYHIRHFTLLCLPKGGLLRSNRLSLKKSLEKATEELRRLWKGQLWREMLFIQISLYTPCWCRASSKHRGGSSWLRPVRRGSRLFRTGRPLNYFQKLSKSDQKVVKMESQRGSRTSFGGQKPKMDARRAKRPILVAKSVPQGCQNGSQMGLKIL